MTSPLLSCMPSTSPGKQNTCECSSVRGLAFLVSEFHLGGKLVSKRYPVNSLLDCTLPYSTHIARPLQAGRGEKEMVGLLAFQRQLSRLKASGI